MTVIGFQMDIVTLINAKKTNINGDYFIYDKFVYIDDDTKGEIICPLHGSFFQSPKNHLNNKYGCRKCAGHLAHSDSVKEKRKQTNLERYGVENPLTSKNSSGIHKKGKKLSSEQKDAIRKSRFEKYGNYHNLEKTKQTNLEKYGVENQFQREDIRKIAISNSVSEKAKEKRKHTNLEKYGVENVFASNEVKEKLKKIWGSSSPAKNEDTKEKISSTWLAKTDEELNIIAQKRTKTKRIVSSDGEKLDSSWELIVWEFCKRNNIPITRSYPIYMNSKRRTFIDFEINNKLFEVKSPHLLNGIFDYANNGISEKLKAYKRNLVTIITSENIFNLRANSSISNGHKYLHKCPEPLVCVSLSLFKNPPFPYDPRKPKCYYRVKFDNKLSPLEAWDNELLRWKMILNRIDYSGGWIDEKAVLNAYNITRVCKQPSWFSETFARQIIRAYISTKTIIDPFAGWGTRLTASEKEGKKYIGIDANKDLVEWMKKPNYVYNDATTWTYEDEDATVFTCPPYGLTEQYFPGQLDLTTDEWINIVLKNVKCKEYIFVVKKTEQYKNYIIQTINNKSHFGNNYEHILRIQK
jgi:hypothetical protein